MRFIGQIELRKEYGFNTPAKMAYLFMTEEEDDSFVDVRVQPVGEAPILRRALHLPGRTSLALPRRPCVSPKSDSSNATGGSLTRRLLSLKIATALIWRKMLDGIPQHRSGHDGSVLIEKRFEDGLRFLSDFSQHPA